MLELCNFDSPKQNVAKQIRACDFADFCGSQIEGFYSAPVQQNVYADRTTSADADWWRWRSAASTQSVDQSFQRVFLRLDCARSPCPAPDAPNPGLAAPEAGGSAWWGSTGMASIVADVVQLAESFGAWVAADTKFILNCAWHSK